MPEYQHVTTSIASLNDILQEVPDCTHPKGWEIDLAERRTVERDAALAENVRLRDRLAAVEALCRDIDPNDSMQRAPGWMVRDACVSKFRAALAGDDQ